MNVTIAADTHLAPRRRSDRGLYLAVGVLILLALSAAVGPMLLPWHANAVDLPIRLRPPSWAHPFGTDQFGRDLLVRVLAGARVSLLVGLLSVVVAAGLGMFLGAASALAGSRVDGAIMSVLDALLAFPALILGIGIALAIGAGVLAAGIAVTITAIPWYARRARSEVLSIKGRPFVDAERLMGWGRPHLLWRHMIPAVVGGIIVQASLGVGYSVLTIAALGYVGLGAQPPAAEWGLMISEGQSYLLAGQWWLAIMPGLGLLFFVALSIYIGDKLGNRLGYAV